MRVEGFAMVMAWWSALRRAMARHVPVVDGLLAVALGAGAAVGSADAATDAGPAVSPMDWLGFGLVGVTAAGLVARRRSPVAAFAVSYSATLVYLLHTDGVVADTHVFIWYIQGSSRLSESTRAILDAATAADCPS